MYVPNQDLLYVAITGPDIGGARAHLHVPTQRFALVHDGDADGAYISLGESADDLRNRGYSYIAIGE